MKKSFLILLTLIVTSFSFSQNLLKEPFDYPVKDSLDGIGGWNSSGISKSKVKVVSPGLAYAGYAGSGIGNAVQFPNIDKGDLCSKQLKKIDSGSVYLSYLLRVESIAAAATQGYNITLDQYGGPTNVNLRSYIQRVSDSTFKIGVTKHQAVAYVGTTFKTQQTYLVVLTYRFEPGAANDSAKIYILSSGVPESEPAKPDTFTVTGNDAADIGEIWLSNAFAQTGLKGSSVTVDEIRVGRSWETAVTEPAVSVLTEDFYYSAGDSLRGKNGWDVYAGGVPLLVDSTGLTYSGYPGSGAGKAMKIVGGSGSQSLFRPFSLPGDSILFLSFMTKVSGTQAAQGYFVSLSNVSAGNYRAVVYARIDSGKVRFGLRPTLGGTIVFDTTAYAAGKTYVVVVKYRVTAGSNNDETSLFVFSAGIPLSEPAAASVGPLTMPNDAISAASVVLNSGAFTAGSALNGATILVDGIRVSNNWVKGLTGVQHSAQRGAPEGFVLSQNFPNPFNPTTTIGFTLPVSGFATLTVYDAIGREVAVLVNEHLEAGVYHERIFNAPFLSSGIYFYRLQSGSAVQMKKMILVK